MKNSARHPSWTLRLNLQPVTAALAIAILFAAAVLTQSAQAQTFTVIHTFTGLGEDGANPYAGLVMDRGGNLYGVTEYGGTGPCSTQYTQGCGTVFKMKPTGSGWTYEPLYSFTGASNNDGAYPYFGGLTIGPDGSLYGTTTEGGLNESCDGNPGCGTVFNLKPGPTRPATALTPWAEKVLYRFQQAPDGNVPDGLLAFDAAGNIYGTTVYGGTNNYYYWGTVFELTPSAGQWTEKLIYSFYGEPDDGAQSFSGVVADQNGNLYGTTFAGGTDNAGTLFQLSPSGSGWKESILYKFITNGTQPYSTPIFDSAGNLYGGTTAGERTNSPVIYEISPPYLGGQYSILYTFDGYYDGGPAAPLLMDAAGNLFGTTKGQNSPYGTVFEISPSSGGWVYTLLHQFTRGNDGGNPYSNVVMDAQGNLYGTASVGGGPTYCSGGCGVVWEITP